MSQKNLLEAFRSAGAVAGTPPPATPPAPKVQPPAPPPPTGAEGGREMPAWLPWLAPILLAFLLGVFVGRGSVGESEVEAGGGDGTSSMKEDGGGSAGPAAPENTNEVDESPTAALFDLVNQYTLVVATYGKDKVDYANAAYYELLDEGFQVFPPYRTGSHLLILVGATASQDGLEEFRRRVRALRDGAYEDAYVQRIDQLIDREP